MSEECLRYLNQEVVTENSKYTITDYISEGGNGFVFECCDNQGKTYVLKLLHTTSKVKVENFKKEVAIQKKINSEYIVKCIDSGEKCFGSQRSPRPFYIMDKYDTTLENLIDGDIITPLKAYKYMIQLCKALKVLHKSEDPIIHRDLKPENILYDASNDRVLICDFGLAHLNTNNNSINDGFVGNIDYHAPEQKKRGKTKVGTYTDIYSLGLIINVLFTKEIAQGENYRKIWQVNPRFSYLDDIVSCMIKHDIESREHDINVILFELERHEIDYEVEESLYRDMYKEKALSENGVIDLISLFSLFDYSVKNKMNWEEINLNYYCDFHFSCKDILKNSVLLKQYYDLIKKKFEIEGTQYDNNEIAYEPIDLSYDENKEIYDLFTEKIDSMKVLYEMKKYKNIIKKYLISLSDYHVLEIIKEIVKIEKDVSYNCTDVPILWLASYLNEKLPNLCDWEYVPYDYIVFDEYVPTNLENVRKFTREIDLDLKMLIAKMKLKFNDITYVIKKNNVEICFELFKSEDKFIKIINKIIKSFDDNNPKRADLINIINQEDYVGNKKLYIIDQVDLNTIINHWPSDE